MGLPSETCAERMARITRPDSWRGEWEATSKKWKVYTWQSAGKWAFREMGEGALLLRKLYSWDVDDATREVAPVKLIPHPRVTWEQSKDAVWGWSC